MGKKDKQFSESQEWLDWLSDAKADKEAGNNQKPSVEPVYGSQRPISVGASSNTRRPNKYAVGLRTQSQLNRSRHSLGLDPSAFRDHGDPALSNSPAQYKSKRRSSKLDSSPEGSITLNFHFPTIRFPKMRINWRKVLPYVAIGAVIIVLVIVTPNIMSFLNKGKSVKTSNNATDKPSFATLAPSKEDSAYVQESQSYDATKQVYHFKGQYNGVDVVGTEQVLPDIFKNSEVKLKEQADSIGATNRIEVVDGIVYVSPDDNNTSQRAVYASRQVLVFVTYYGVMKDSEWVKFIQSLE